MKVFLSFLIWLVMWVLAFIPEILLAAVIKIFKYPVTTLAFVVACHIVRTLSNCIRAQNKDYYTNGITPNNRFEQAIKEGWASMQTRITAFVASFFVNIINPLQIITIVVIAYFIIGK